MKFLLVAVLLTCSLNSNQSLPDPQNKDACAYLLDENGMPLNEEEYLACLEGQDLPIDQKVID